MHTIVVEGIRQVLISLGGNALWNAASNDTQINFDAGDAIVSTEDVAKLTTDACDYINRHGDLFQALKQKGIIQGDQIRCEDLLKVYGKAFPDFIAKGDYCRLLIGTGRTFVDLLLSLNKMHSYLEFQHKGLRPPRFHVQTLSNKELILHYYSQRCSPSFDTYVAGQLEAIAKTRYNIQDLQVDLITDMSTTEELTNAECGHVRFMISSATKPLSNPSVDDFGPLEDVKLSVEAVHSLYPYHVAFGGPDNRILSVGNKLCNLKMVNENGSVVGKLVGQSMQTAFSIEYPRIKWPSHASKCKEFKDQHILSEFTLRSAAEFSYVPSTKHKSSPVNVGHGLTLKGPILFEWRETADALWFLGTPEIESLDEMAALNMRMSDLSLGDGSADLFLSRIQENERLQHRLADATKAQNELTEEHEKLNEAIKENNDLLRKLLPANRTYEKNVPLENGDGNHTTKRLAVNHCLQEHESVSFLFTDIKSFTAMSNDAGHEGMAKILSDFYGEVDPIIGEMNKCGGDLFKLETQGDAYTVISGISDKNEYHSQQIVEFAFRIHKISMDSNIPLRFGIHCGKSHSTVMSEKVPTYLHFGDTYNIGKKIESKGREELPAVRMYWITRTEITRCEEDLERQSPITSQNEQSPTQKEHENQKSKYVSQRKQRRTISPSTSNMCAEAAKTAVLKVSRSGPIRFTAPRRLDRLAPMRRRLMSHKIFKLPAAASPYQSSLIPKITVVPK